MERKVGRVFLSTQNKMRQAFKCCSSRISYGFFNAVILSLSYLFFNTFVDAILGISLPPLVKFDCHVLLDSILSL